jgi:glyoxylase-like metal-dependent hydrolase (beta-lactamase superfamily II)
VFVIKLNGKLVLCDAGGGNQVQAFNPVSVFVSGKMMANMRAAGIDPKKIETVLISHFHPDHIFGLLERKDTNSPVFPNAEIIVPAAEYKWSIRRSSAVYRQGAGRWPAAFRSSSRSGRTCSRWRAKTRWCPESVSSAHPDTRPATPPST